MSKQTLTSSIIFIDQAKMVRLENHLILSQFNSEVIEADIQTTSKKRQVLQHWVQLTGTTWDYSPHFDLSQNAMAQLEFTQEPCATKRTRTVF